MSTKLAASTFPVALNQASRDAFTSALTNQSLKIYRGNRVNITCALFRANPQLSTFIDDLSNLTGANLVMRQSDANGTLQFQKSLSASALNGSLTFAQWQAQTANHFEFDLTSADTNYAAGTYYLAIDVLTNDSGAITVGTTTATIIEDGIGSAATPTGADPTSYSRTEADARFAPLPLVGTGLAYASTITSAAGTTGATDLGGVNDSMLPTYFALMIREYATNSGVGLTTWVIEPTTDALNGARSINVKTYNATTNPRAWRQRA